MLTCALLALASSDDDVPACLLEIDGEPIVRRLASQVAERGRVVVVTDAAWRPDVEVALASAAEIVTVAGTGEALAWIGSVADGDLLLLDAATVTGDLALERVAERHPGTAAVLVAAADIAAGFAVRVAQGRVVAAASAYHRVQEARHVGIGSLRIGEAGGAAVRGAAEQLQALLRNGPSVQDRALERDLVALLTVAIVREGSAVAVRQLPRGLVWARPRTGSAAADAAHAVAAVDEERVRLDTAVKAEDGFFTTFFVSPYSRYWARWAARRGFTPNQVTVVSMLVAIAAALAFATGHRMGAVAGAILLQLAFTLDCVDGQLARYARRFSAFGAWLDSMFDRGKEYVAFAGLAAGGVRAGDDGLWLLAAAALALQVVRHSLDFGYGAQKRSSLGTVGPHPLTDVDEAGVSFWEPGAHTSRPTTAAGSSARVKGVRRLAGGTIGLLRRTEGIAPLKWAKRIVVLPIGERFAVISLVTAIWSPRATFLVLLLWGGLAAGYTLGGRVVRSIS